MGGEKLFLYCVDLLLIDVLDHLSTQRFNSICSTEFKKRTPE